MGIQNEAAAGTAAPENTDKPMTAAEAALFLGVCKGYLYKLVERNKIAHYRPGGKTLYFMRDDLEKYVFRNRISSRYEVHEKAENILNGAR